jgi:hypothetical protein
VSRADVDLQEQVRAFHVGETGPQVKHFVAPGPALHPAPAEIWP